MYGMQELRASLSEPGDSRRGREGVHGYAALRWLRHMRGLLQSESERDRRKEYSVDELVKELKKDEMFYEESGGGVTLSGGEVMTADMAT